MRATAGRALAAAERWSSWGDTTDFYRFSLSLGLRSMDLRHARAALPRILNPLSYPRGMKFALTLRALHLPERASVDVASPKLLFLWLTAKSQLELTATDIVGGFIPNARYLLGRLGLAEEIGERLRLEAQDARRLTYADGSFDTYSISVAARRSSSSSVATTPRRYRSTSSGRRGCGRRSAPISASLCRDLTATHLSMALRLPLAWAQPLFERALLPELSGASEGGPSGVALTLVKEGCTVDG